MTVLHEYGHAIDLALVPEELNAALEAGIPRTGACGDYGGVKTGSCAEPAERFADTFAKWALRGSVSAVGAGYQVANPPSLEELGRAADGPGEPARRAALALRAAGGPPCRPRP